MKGLIDTAFHYSRTVLSLLVLILIAGTVSYVTIPKESNPDINVPWIFVSISHPGISPEDAARLLVRPMEKELQSIEAVKEITATASEGKANITLEFDAGFDADTALQDVRERVDIARAELPADTEEPRVIEINLSEQPILDIALSGNVPERALYRLGRDLRDRIETLPNVLSADLTGDRVELLEIVVDPSLLVSYEISQADLVRAVTLNNRLVAAGVLDTGEGRFAVKVPGLFKTARDLFDLPIKTEGDAVVTVGDLTSVRRTYKDRFSMARLNGKPALLIEVKKRAGKNVIGTVEEVRALVSAESKNWPPGVDVTYTYDDSEDIRRMLGDLQNNIIAAIVLVMIIVVAALGVHTAGLVGLAIPASFLFGILVLNLMGVTVNIVVLFALILAVGMLVDGAIVVTEYADRKMAEGHDRRAAYGLAAKRMSWPIIASTATTLAAFMPLLFWPDIIGEFMFYLPLTLIATLTGSLLMALIFVPTLGSLMGRAGSSDPAVLRALKAAEHGDVTSLPGITGWYTRLLSRLIHYPFRVLGAAVGTLVLVTVVFIGAGNGVEFFPQSHEHGGRIFVHARGNLSIDEKSALVAEVEQRVLPVKGLKSLYSLIGGGTRRGKAEDIVGSMTFQFVDWGQRRPGDEIFAEIRERTANMPGMEIEVFSFQSGPRQGKDIQIQTSSRYPDAILPVIRRIRGFVDDLDGLTDIEDTRPMPGIQWEMEVDRAQAGKFGSDISSVGYAVQLVTNGIKLGEYRPDDADDEVEIRVRYPLGSRNIGALDLLRVKTDHGLVPISNFVKRVAKPKVGTIRRVDGERVMTIQMNTAQGVLADNKVKEIRAWLDTAGIDPRVDFSFRGQKEQQDRSSAFLKKAFAVALFVMAIILVTQFNSFYHATLILTAVIMSTVGVMLGLLITGKPFGIVMNGIGVIALAGIVVNNNIVLIDTFARLKRSGMPVMEAIVRTGAQRLRPVMLTTITTIFGLLPMVFEFNIDFISRTVEHGGPSFAFWTPLATSIVFGLAFATLLTLVVTPCLLALPVKLTEWWEGRHAARLAARVGAE